MYKKVSSIFSQLYLDYVYDNLKKIFSRFEVGLLDVYFIAIDNNYSDTSNFISSMRYQKGETNLFENLEKEMIFNYDNIIHKKHALSLIMDFEDMENLYDLAFRYEKTLAQIEFVKKRIASGQMAGEDLKTEQEWVENAERSTLKAIDNNIKYKVESQTIANRAKCEGKTSVLSLLLNEHNLRAYVLVVCEEVPSFEYATQEGILTETEYYSNSKLLMRSVEELIFYFLAHFMNIANFNDEDYCNAVIDISEILTKSANNLFHDCLQPYGIVYNELYTLINELSVSKYEGKSVRGSIAFLYKGHMNILVPFVVPIPLNFDNSRKIRKLLEMTNGKFSLLSDCSYIYGLGQVSSHTEYSYYQISFLDYFHWEFTKVESKQQVNCSSKSTQHIFETKYGRPSIYKMNKFETNFESILLKEFVEIDCSHNKDEIAQQFNALINAAITQKHGTMVVIADNMLEEVERFKGACIEVPGIELTSDTMKLVTAIDGAVLLDCDCKCLAIGAILDGHASGDGSSARGARYNSAIRYLNYQKHERKKRCLIVVVSEDGDVECLYTSKEDPCKTEV